MFHSLHERLLTLDDEVEVWPGHLGGSLCGGAGIDLKSSSTIGFERAHNPALAIADQADFVEDAAPRCPTARRTSSRSSRLNRGPLIEGFGTPAADHPARGREGGRRGRRGDRRPHQRGVRRGPHRGRPQHLRLRHRLRHQGLAGGPPGVEIIVVAGSDVDECEAAELLAAVGLRVRGYLEGGMTAWRIDGRPVERIELIDPGELAKRVGGRRGR